MISRPLVPSVSASLVFYSFRAGLDLGRRVCRLAYLVYSYHFVCPGVHLVGYFAGHLAFYHLDSCRHVRIQLLQL